MHPKFLIKNRGRQPRKQSVRNENNKKKGGTHGSPISNFIQRAQISERRISRFKQKDNHSSHIKHSKTKKKAEPYNPKLKGRNFTERIQQRRLNEQSNINASKFVASSISNPSI